MLDAGRVKEGRAGKWNIGKEFKIWLDKVPMEKGRDYWGRINNCTDETEEKESRDAWAVQALDMKSNEDRFSELDPDPWLLKGH